MLTRAPRGTRDILPDESIKWVFLENKFRDHCKTFCYKEIRTPIFEHTELFTRGVGETTDIVQKEMYTFLDKGGRSITLKPEGTAPTARAFIEHKLYSQALPQKYFYIIPGFRYERPQAGRLREFHQFGVEAFGSNSPGIDVEIMVLAMTFLKSLGLDDLKLYINSIGCPECRQEYKKALKAFIKERIDGLCNTCRERWDKNPLRILDCKNPECREIIKDAPTVLEYLCSDCKNHFQEVQDLLSALSIDFIVDDKIVRGLDYYTKTVFEIISDDLGAQSTVCGGGRYDNLIEECGGPPTPATGFGMGIERLISILDKKNLLNLPNDNLDVFLALADETFIKEATVLLYYLRQKGLSVEMDYIGRSLKAQLKYANKLATGFVVIIGEEEVKTGLYTVKNFQEGSQEKVQYKDIYKYIANFFRKRGC